MKKILVFCFCVFAFLGCNGNDIEESLLKWEDLRSKADPKSAEYIYFKTYHSKEIYLNHLQQIAIDDKRFSEKHGGIKSKEAIVIEKSEDGNKARVKLIIKYNDGKIIGDFGSYNMIKIGSKWLLEDL